jgi:predicted ATP-dependent endonuclease of OLD family
MYLIKAEVGPFKSISEPQEVVIDEKVTVLVGMNESGKTVFLQSLEKSFDALAQAKFNPVDDYPRKDLSAYLKKHDQETAVATTLYFRLTDDEVAQVTSTTSIKHLRNS